MPRLREMRNRCGRLWKPRSLVFQAAGGGDLPSTAATAPEGAVQQRAGNRSAQREPLPDDHGSSDRPEVAEHVLHVSEGGSDIAKRRGVLGGEELITDPARPVGTPSPRR